MSVPVTVWLGTLRRNMLLSFLAEVSAETLRVCTSAAKTQARSSGSCGVTSNGFASSSMRGVLQILPGRVRRLYLRHLCEPDAIRSLIEAPPSYSSLCRLGFPVPTPVVVARRVGMAYANEEIIQYMNNVKAPYNVNRLSQEVAVKALSDRSLYRERVATILEARRR